MKCHILFIYLFIFDAANLAFSVGIISAFAEFYNETVVLLSFRHKAILIL